ncbi:Type 1 glutamine amidotransferase-like domain-containing protein [Candidatus Nomurabacteria bacterium]|uniref:Type 1 glutamine amidotransferase-like domain-containing protein n=1 Tax=Candidatus Dojkabacteria bacterium TaxID=2099670 RepID=A0A955KY65_9BACT|nr:Type 1 glutamine amidotransferase-like domain-containing protein [Candidatus Dojkabacteria bacterium]MCB9803234.1 Type 1 glutamine amidotransferase-like domain-containing protein [Candidatus Nomurabacteria bacterium]
MIVLGGGGDEKSGYEAHKHFYTLIGKDNPRILYIPVALDPTKHPWDSCLSWITNAFYGFGDIHFDMITELDQLSGSALTQYDGIYIGGGNTYKLLKIIYDTEVDEALRNYEKKGVIFGGSAGAIIMGADISTAETFDPNEVGLDVTKGLDMISGYSVWPHYTEDHTSKIKEWVNDHQIPVLALSEEDTATLADGKWSLSGIHPQLFDLQQ